MEALVLYESFYGNTRKIAYAIAKGISQQKTCKVLQANQINSARLINIDLLVVGSPTVGFHLAPAAFKFIDSLTPKFLAGMKIAAFDSRIKADYTSFSTQTVFLTSYTHAATLIADSLVEKGGQLIAAPQGFQVHTPKGPLVDGELHRATLWGALLSKNYHLNIGKLHQQKACCK